MTYEPRPSALIEIEKNKSILMPYKDEIENLIKSDYSISSIHSYISEKYGIKISKRSFFAFLSRHIKNERKESTTPTPPKTNSPSNDVPIQSSTNVVLHKTEEDVHPMLRDFNQFAKPKKS